MASLVDICNLALLQLGEESIISVEFDAAIIKRAKLCKHFYPFVRDAVLRAYPWQCARYKKSLARLAEVPVDTWAYQFSLPIDPYCLWVPKMLNEDVEYEINGRKLLTDESSIIITFIHRITETGLYDSLLVEAIAARLAHMLAYPLTGVASTTELMWKLYELKLREARTTDGLEEGKMKVYSANALTEVR